MTRTAYLIACTLPLIACGDDAASTDTTPTDTNTDTTDATSADTTGDTGGDTGDAVGDATSETATDTGPGQSVAGTALAGVTLAWDAPLTLCSSWSEGASLADEKARKVQLTIAPASFASLDEDVLAQALDDVIVVRGPMASDRVVGHDVARTVTSWQLLESAGGDTLGAEVAHNLGDGGTLFMNVAVSRQDGHADPVVVTPEGFDVRFAWQTPGDSGLQPVLLQRCGGAPTYEDAVSVAVAVDGKRWATLVRYWRSVAGADAGSYPVELVAHHIITSDSVWWTNQAWGPWSQTYVAQHHNFADASEVDFTRDLGLWHTFFRAPAEGDTRVKRVLLANVLTPNAATMTIETQTGATVTSEVLPIPEPQAFVRIDAATLGRELEGECADGSVLAVGADEHRVQLMLCQGDKGPELVGVVPIVWSSEPTRSSKRVNEITAQDTGWDVQIGDFVLAVRRQDEGVYTTEVRNAAAEVVTSSYEVAAPLALAMPREETLVASQESPPISMSLTRRWAGYGIGKSQLWAPVRFTLTFDGVTREVEAWDQFDYTNTHHNWEDALEATADDGTVMRWHTSFFDGTPNIVSATSASGTVLLAPVDLGK